MLSLWRTASLLFNTRRAPPRHIIKKFLLSQARVRGTLDVCLLCCALLCFALLCFAYFALPRLSLSSSPILPRRQTAKHRLDSLLESPRANTTRPDALSCALMDPPAPAPPPPASSSTGDDPASSSKRFFLHFSLSSVEATSLPSTSILCAKLRLRKTTPRCFPLPRN